MKDLKYDSVNLPFKESQIICLEHQATCLYGEVIQLIVDRDMCWFRPICMNIAITESNQNLKNYDLVHLPSSSDLLWPIPLFRPAFDTEVLSLFSELNSTDELVKDHKSSREYLNKFIYQVWIANQDKF